MTANVAQIVAPEDTYVVVGYRGEDIRGHLGPSYRYVVQEMPRGTGDAVLQLQPLLQDFDGDLLILYGDTPLFSATSIRGLINRHRLREANLTLLTAVVDRPYPYGRVIRDRSGRIMDIIEEAQATADVREIRELNVGAYVVSARQIWPVLEALPPSPLDGDYRLTDSAHPLIHYGSRVESYQIYDQDEIQGINTPADLEQAEFILQKRLFRPRQQEERNIVHFGTGGWRAVIGEGFTLHNVRRLCQALANDITRRGLEKRGVLIGYDRRFLSDQAAEAAAEVFAGNNIHTILLEEDAPTPLINYATEVVNAAFGLAFTASHNPPEWNGLKVFHGDGSLLLTEETNADRGRDQRADGGGRGQDPAGRRAGGGHRRAPRLHQRVRGPRRVLHRPGRIRSAGLKVIVDPMYGVGHLTLGIILNEARCRVTFIHERHNPLFGGRSPAPDLEALRMLRTFVRDEEVRPGAGDRRRRRPHRAGRRARQLHLAPTTCCCCSTGICTRSRGSAGAWCATWRPPICSTGWRPRFGEKCVETPVGFKWIAAGMVEHDALLGGESSGGLTIRGHILGKDGIFAAALIVEMLAVTGKRISRAAGAGLRPDGPAVLGRGQPAGHRRNAHRRAAARPGDDRTGRRRPIRIERVSYDDGIKIYLENDNWVLLRFSGTEPVLRIFAEADTPEKAAALISWLAAFALAPA